MSESMKLVELPELPAGQTMTRSHVINGVATDMMVSFQQYWPEAVRLLEFQTPPGFILEHLKIGPVIYTSRKDFAGRRVEKNVCVEAYVRNIGPRTAPGYGIWLTEEVPQQPEQEMPHAPDGTGSVHYAAAPQGPAPTVLTRMDEPPQPPQVPVVRAVEPKDLGLTTKIDDEGRKWVLMPAEANDVPTQPVPPAPPPAQLAAPYKAAAPMAPSPPRDYFVPNPTFPFAYPPTVPGALPTEQTAPHVQQAPVVQGGMHQVGLGPTQVIRTSTGGGAPERGQLGIEPTSLKAEAGRRVVLLSAGRANRVAFLLGGGVYSDSEKQEISAIFAQGKAFTPGTVVTPGMNEVAVAMTEEEAGWIESLVEKQNWGFVPELKEHPEEVEALKEKFLKAGQGKVISP